ncbi:hypothetical protein B0A58_04355 [Flavobacterium branchiophilum NBRC 15030 = ATCC 35035]|uniref:RHS repeat-associated protein n=1 Tax=Flavobacterium branchiophilum TaxID=55197 RepID=A0A543G3G5_9FLAO|nr:RHS repeat-associated core domain-containing protein [Flavobacterium branchiophilum]OXA78463.1 hypothetical protein B0A58_04355 [Flavobacterium branchiophilum NBRC 15030 = ATCC 35035]TQM40554.1 RHS repeat-associated protein [Flavobacterium branchiophilum]GEM55874.1 hypothetical protein FB1_20950 [Flavobacterium branchiophilum NBRC 15030 = ATCC 35035]
MAQQLGNNYYNSPYKFNGKELDDETGFYYYGARYYDPRVSVWMSVDPMAEKYPNISPYVYVANNPINAIDPDGRDIIILSHGPRGKTSIDGGKTNAHPHIVGHMSVLIGNDKTGWTYLSYDYDNGTNKGRGKSGKNDVFTIHKFDKLSDFKNSEHNTFKDDYDDGKGTKTSHRDADGNIVQRYQNAYQIKSDAETDAKMIEAGISIFDTKWTEVKELGQANQCTTVAEKALDAGGLKNGERSDFIQYQAKSGIPYKTHEMNYLPATKQNAIEKKNKGIDVDNIIRRTN